MRQCQCEGHIVGEEGHIVGEAIQFAGKTSAVSAGCLCNSKLDASVVPSETNQRIGFFSALNPDCTTSGDISIRVTKELEHGAVQITPTTNFPNYAKEGLRYKCNQHKVKGMQINYKSAEKYIGDDVLELLVLFPAGFAWEIHFDLSVR